MNDECKIALGILSKIAQKQSLTHEVRSIIMGSVVVLTDEIRGLEKKVTELEELTTEPKTIEAKKDEWWGEGVDYKPGDRVRNEGVTYLMHDDGIFYPVPELKETATE